MPEYPVTKASFLDPLLNFDHADQYSILIQVGDNAFTYCIFDHSTNIFMGLVHLTAQNNGQGELNQLLQLDEIRELGKYNFRHSRILIENNLSTLVPDSIHNEEDAGSFFELNHHPGKDFKINTCKLPNLGAHMIFGMDGSTHDTLSALFQGASVFHHTFPLIEGLMIRFKHFSSDERIFVNVREDNLDIFIFGESGLLFFNSFEYQAAEDFLYYLLYSSEQFGMNPETFRLVLMGAIEEESEIYKLLYKYIRKIQFISRNEGPKYSRVLMKIPAHAYYNLFTLNQCV